jgi:hypothetical protein
LKTIPPIFFLALTFLWQPLKGQLNEYQLLKSDFIVFEPIEEIAAGAGCYNCSHERYFSGIRIDSSKTKSTSVTYYFNREIIDDGSECLAMGPSIIGDSLIEYENGTSTCFTLNGNEITIDRTLSLNESSVIYLYENGNYLTATVNLHEPEVLFNVTDSVKTFLIQLFDADNNMLNDPINNSILKISKSFGLIRFSGFRDFPGYRNGEIVYELLSNDHLQRDVIKLIFSDIYDFNIGDEFHYLITDYSLGPDGYENIRKIVIDKTMSDSEDSVNYTIDERRWGFKIVEHNPIQYEYYQMDTIYHEVYTGLKEFVLAPKQMPFEAVFEQGFNVVSNALMYRSQFNGRLTIRKNGQSLLFNGECLSSTHDSYGGSFVYYIVGCGDLYSSIISETVEECYPCEHLGYYKKGDEEWGQPLLVPNETTAPYSVTLHPNPANDKIEIESTVDIESIRILTLHGKEVQILTNINSVSVIMDVSSLNPGFHILIIKTQNGWIQVEKLLIK